MLTLMRQSSRIYVGARWSIGGYRLQPYRRPPSFFSSLIFLGLLVGVAVGVGTKTYLVYNKVLYSWMFLWLDYTDKVKPQQKKVNFFADGRTMQMPVDGTVARGYMPYEYKGNPEGAGQFLVNPADQTSEVLAHGKKLYNIYCTACHGTYGDGDGKVVVREAGKGLKPRACILQELRRMVRWSNLPCD